MYPSGLEMEHIRDDLPPRHDQQRECNDVQCRGGRDKVQLWARNPEDRECEDNDPANCEPACVVGIRIFLININVSMSIGEKQSQPKGSKECSFMHLSKKQPEDKEQ